MRSWIFQANPDRFDLDGYLAAGLPRITWTVRRHADEITVGDEAFLWRSGGSRPDKEGSSAGIFARAHIASAPWDGPDHAEARPFWRNAAEAATVETRVWLVVDRVADKKGIIRRDWLLDDPVCRELLILKQAAGTNFPVAPELLVRLRALWDRTGEDWTRAESLAALRTYHRTYGGPLSRAAGSPVAELALLLGRAVSGAYNKILNFRSIDPRDARKGLDGAGQVDRDVWTEFYDPAAETIRAESLEAEYQRLWPSAAAPAPDVPELAEHSAEFERQVRTDVSRSLEELEAAYAGRSRDPRPKSTRVPATVFDRDALVVAIARKRAGNRCEVPGCTYEPFLTTNGDSYVEVHHIETLAAGGPDTPENAACLCPAHHRQVHLGAGADVLRAQLREIRARG